mmetsp:Transcript_1229/g.2851  ORF Transcript_1229/g.2851 Transcript_1229/m.2851 type:complete len:87 (-) Transcript_1229:733-993(-)
MMVPPSKVIHNSKQTIYNCPTALAGPLRNRDEVLLKSKSLGRALKAEGHHGEGLVLVPCGHVHQPNAWIHFHTQVLHEGFVGSTGF